MISKEQILDFLDWAHERYNISLTEYDNYGHATLSVDNYLLVDNYLKEQEDVQHD